MTKIEQELQEAVDFETQKGEKKQAYLTRLIEAIDELDDTEFGKMSKEAKAWAEAAAKAQLSKSPIPDFESDEEGSEEEVETSEEGPEEEEPEEEKAAKPRGSNGAKHVKKASKEKVAAKPAKTAKGTKSAAPKAKSKAVKEKAPRAAQARPRGSLPTGRNKYVQDVLCDDPNASIEDIIKVLEKKGVEVPSRITISTSRSSFRSALETLNRKGMLKEPVDLSGRN